MTVNWMIIMATRSSILPRNNAWAVVDTAPYSIRLNAIKGICTIHIDTHHSLAHRMRIVFRIFMMLWSAHLRFIFIHYYCAAACVQFALKNNKYRMSGALCETKQSDRVATFECIERREALEMAKQPHNVCGQSPGDLRCKGLQSFVKKIFVKACQELF